MKSRSTARAGLALVFYLVIVALVASMALGSESALISSLAKAFLAATLLVLVFWLLWRLARRALWRVGRRLAFSYFLIGVLPIPMVGLLVLLNAYLLSGYFLGHLYRDALRSLHQDLVVAAEERLIRWRSGGETREDEGDDLSFAYYRDDHKVLGGERFPDSWPKWLAELEERAQDTPSERERVFDFVALPDGRPTLATATSKGRLGVVGVFQGDVDPELSRRGDLWVALVRADDPEKDERVRFSLREHEFALRPLNPKRTLEERAEFFGSPKEDPGWWERPFIWWGELSGPLRDLADGSTVSEYVAASLNGHLTTVYRHLFSTSGEVDTTVWISLIAITGLLSSIYALAILMAFFMIFSLSRAVNRLSRATEAVRRGEFATRMPAKRKDQMGELQRSFNEMTTNLEQSVLAVAQKESLERELQIARNLQESLLPADLPSSETVDFATLFEPSAAIGGDYFDILRLDEDRLVVVIADVSGHGLSTGLRMAMLKAALVILVEERKEPVEIFRRLSSMVKAEGDRRLFVTSTIAVIDFRRGEMELTNAGHPPTYLLRDGEVEEILLQGNPLGALGEDYGHRRVTLESGDVVVWLSDGLIEATDGRGEPFGYERLREALRGPAPRAAEVRNRLVAAAGYHAGATPSEDDKTLVAMAFHRRASQPTSTGDRHRLASPAPLD
jgi:serine phosphatase RsbU (regulator of sigma subunit)